MGKKVKEYKSGDFIFAKVKGYPAWPARVQRLNGKKYFVYFYGTGETANLAPNMIFDYAENKDKFLTKTVKRRDFNDGVKQIEHDFANNVPLEEVIGSLEPTHIANDTVNDTANDTIDDSAMDTTAADNTTADTTANNTTQNDIAVEDSDEAGTLVIDEGKGNVDKQQQKPRKSKAETPKPPAKEPKTPKTPRGKNKKEDSQVEDEQADGKVEEIVSRSGRKIRPKRYIDEQTEENTTLPPAAKKRRSSPPLEREKEKEGQSEPVKEKIVEKNLKQLKIVAQSELEDLKEPFKPADTEKENILIAYIPSGQYVGIKLWQSRPSNLKDSARLQWERQAARNALTLKMQLEKGHITPQSISEQLFMDLNLTDEEKTALDKEREIEEKKSRVQFLKTEMKLIELDAKIKTCLCLEKADTELCLKLLDQLLELDIKPLMLLKQPHCIETMKRMRAYVGNTPSWDLNQSQQLLFSQQAARIRKQADVMYNYMKDLFCPPAGLSFWEYFSERVLQLKRATAASSAAELLELVHEPVELSQPSAVTMTAAVEAASKEPFKDDDTDNTPAKKKNATAKSKKANITPKTPAKRQNSRKQDEKEKEVEKEKTPEIPLEDTTDATQNDKLTNENTNENVEEITQKDTDLPEKVPEAVETEESEKEKEGEHKEQNSKEDSEKDSSSGKKEKKDGDVNSGKKEKKDGDSSSDKKKKKDGDSNSDKNEKKDVDSNSDKKEKKDGDSNSDKNEKKDGDSSNGKKEKKDGGSDKKDSKESEKKEIEVKEDEPRAKRSRGENKKTEPPPPRSPISKRKSKV